MQKKATKKPIQEAIKRGREIVNEAAGAFSGSWLGYHARVYYANLQPPPPGAHFSAQWGLTRDYGHTTGDWIEYDGNLLFEHLSESIGSPSLQELSESAQKILDETMDLREELLSIIEACLARTDDAYLQKMKKYAEAARMRTAKEIVKANVPSINLMCNDHVAMAQQTQVPPHIQLLAQIEMLESCFEMPGALAQVAKRVSAHLAKKQSARGMAGKQGTKIFIGHGGSAAWRELKDFIEDKLGLEADEFNRKPVAGITNITRLSEMLDEAAIAFLVMTAEDEQKDGKMHARMNVIHEAGLFQGRLGFPRAIIVLEHGCEEFSNIQGLGQIRFPDNTIKAAFQEVREVLEREGLVDP